MYFFSLAKDIKAWIGPKTILDVKNIYLKQKVRKIRPLY